MALIVCTSGSLITGVVVAIFVLLAVMIVLVAIIIVLFTADKPIRVSVLEGDFAVMSSIGLPLSLCVQLQVSCLKLNEALWTARSTPDGFSVSLFWPAPAPEKVDGSRRKKRRKRRRAKASQVTLSSFSKTNQATTSSVLLNNTSSATAANQSGHDSPSKYTPSDHDLPSKPTPLQSKITAMTCSNATDFSVQGETTTCCS